MGWIIISTTAGFLLATGTACFYWGKAVAKGEIYNEIHKKARRRRGHNQKVDQSEDATTFDGVFDRM